MADEKLKVGTKVTWHYRSAIGHGTIEGIAEDADTSAKTKYKIRQHDHHEGEPDVVEHYGSALTVEESTAKSAPNDHVNLSAPFAKVIETKDGGREVWGFATLEVVDKANEIADFKGTIEEFEKWANDTSKRTGGKSLGNVRLMHQPIAVGKTIHWEPSETTVEKEDGTKETVKAIWVGAYVPPTKPDVVKDIDEGILSAFSIGGSYKKRWWDDTVKAFRFIPELAEYSLVDNPCVPGANIVNVISKADGPWSKSERNLGGENVNGELEKRSSAAGSYEELQEKLNCAINRDWRHDRWIVATYPDRIVVNDWDEGKYYEFPYTIDDNGDVQLGECKEVELSYIPVETQKIVKVAKVERDQLKADAEARAKKYGISFKAGKGHLTPPKDYPTDPDEYGDPVNYVYPLDGDRVIAAVGYYNVDTNKAAGGYTDAEWETIGKRIVAKAGKEYSLKDDKIESPSSKEKEAEKLNAIELVKSLIASASDSTVTAPDLATFEKSVLTEATELLKSALGNLTVPEGEGADVMKSAKEVLERLIGDVEKAATAEPVATPPVNEPPAAPTEKTLTPEELAKAGAAISKKRAIHLQHAKNHLDAAMTGTDYTADDHASFEQQLSSKEANGVEQETDAEKSFFDLLRKYIGVEAPAVNLDSVAKSEDVSKAIEAVNGIAKSLDTIVTRLDEMEKRLKTIEEQPVQGGPMSNPSELQRFLKSTPSDTAAIERSVLEKMRDDTSIPLSVRQEIGKNLALQSHPMAKHI